MESNYRHDPGYERARKKVKAMQSFYYSLAAYCIVVPVLIYINLAFFPAFHWFWFSAIGWGTGLLIHGLSAFCNIEFIGKEWQEKKARQLMEKEKQKQPIK